MEGQGESHPTYPDHACQPIVLSRIGDDVNDMVEIMLVLNGHGVGNPLISLEKHPFGTVVVVRGLVRGDELLKCCELGISIVTLFLELPQLLIPKRCCPDDVEVELLGVIVHSGKEGRKVCVVLEAALFEPHISGAIDKDDCQIKSCLLFLDVFRK